MQPITFTVLGAPMPKGSVVARVARKGDGTIVFKNGQPVVIKHDSTGRRGQDDERSIASAALPARYDAGYGLLRTEAVEVEIAFYLPRPKGDYGTGKNSRLLKDSAPARPTKKPDADKLTRHVLDALIHVIYEDDSQVVGLRVQKHYCGLNDPPRTEVTITPLAAQTIRDELQAPQLSLAA